MKASVPIIVIAGAAGSWLALVLVVLKLSASRSHEPARLMRTMATSNSPNDDTLVGSEIMFGPTLLGHVEALVRDPVSSRCVG